MLLAQSPTPSGVDWIALLQTFGLAVVILLGLAAAAWRITGWVARELVIPTRDRLIIRFISFLDKIEQTVDKLDTNVDAITRNLDSQTKSLQSVDKSNQQIVNTLDKQKEMLTTTEKTVVQITIDKHEQILKKIDNAIERYEQIIKRLDHITEKMSTIESTIKQTHCNH